MMDATSMERNITSSKIVHYGKLSGRRIILKRENNKKETGFLDGGRQIRLWTKLLNYGFHAIIFN